ncbi:MAG: hypothetical protein UZ16_OP3001001225 [Candidatus Hinthialibacteria bacterium OLB16]|nr:MAG: hypothetical protein UZ16_OP3001001225 [Candidatus Hinthialibacteria bacterium OLB16]
MDTLQPDLYLNEASLVFHTWEHGSRWKRNGILGMMYEGNISCALLSVCF